MTSLYSRRRATSKRCLAQTFDLVGATALGGLNMLGKFVRKLGVDRELRTRFRDVKAPWAVNQASSISSLTGYGPPKLRELNGMPTLLSFLRAIPLGPTR